MGSTLCLPPSPHGRFRVTQPLLTLMIVAESLAPCNINNRGLVIQNHCLLLKELYRPYWTT